MVYKAKSLLWKWSTITDYSRLVVDKTKLLLLLGGVWAWMAPTTQKLGAKVIAVLIAAIRVHHYFLTLVNHHLLVFIRILIII